jgi:hypothetical protein
MARMSRAVCIAFSEALEGLLIPRVWNIPLNLIQGKKEVESWNTTMRI